MRYWICVRTVALEEESERRRTRRRGGVGVYRDGVQLDIDGGRRSGEGQITRGQGCRVGSCDQRAEIGWYCGAARGHVVYMSVADGRRPGINGLLRARLGRHKQASPISSSILPPVPNTFSGCMSIDISSTIL